MLSLVFLSNQKTKQVEISHKKNNFHSFIEENLEMFEKGAKLMHVIYSYIGDLTSDELWTSAVTSELVRLKLASSCLGDPFVFSLLERMNQRILQPRKNI